MIQEKEQVRNFLPDYFLIEKAWFSFADFIQCYVAWNKVFSFRLIWPKVKYFCLATILFYAILFLNCIILQ